MTVYVVTSGDYSDYKIDCVFSSEALAKAWIKKADAVHSARQHSPLRYAVELYDVDAERGSKNITVWYCGIMLETGEIVERGSTYELRVPFRGNTRQYAVNVPAYSDRLITRVESGVSAEHAEKLAVEARQAWLRDRLLHPEVEQ